MPDDPEPVKEVEAVPEAAKAAGEEVVDESEDLVEMIADRTAGKLEGKIHEAVGPLSDRVLALEQKGESAVSAPPAAVERAVTEAEPPLVRPKRKHWTGRLPRGIF